MMLKTLEKSGKTEEAAIAAALEELGLDRDDVSVEIDDKGFFHCLRKCTCFKR